MSTVRRKHSLTYSAMACVAVIAVVLSTAIYSADALPTASVEELSSSAVSEPPTSLRRDNIEDEVLDPMGELVSTGTDAVDYVDNETSLDDLNRGPHDPKPVKTKKKKPMGKHKKKKQTFKDKLLPLLIIPFAIQTMLMPMFIMNLKMLALKAMTVGKIAILLIILNAVRNWQHNAHSTTIRSSPGDSLLMAQNYGYNGGPEYGAIFNGR